ncbi:Mannosyl-oligosaccharide alpha-1,2-mannosidase 1B [Vermiconidia calcicola]|uniref:Mannosyl-oligosaccharide alpha-1,2-mannosidase 1B n=1 Tax=Vermiconidia calcicola TaxID=1690605 RepID=A0ACC3MEJ9_9PEZI|nr:Mannosyl-oligosaccharide alpha-1,2-mannosidase 1B [Vermiconidia calcicola]
MKLRSNVNRYAFPNDELRPQNNSFSNSRNGWGASAADALSTALVMEIPYIVNEIIDYVPSIDWSVSYDNMLVSLFETTIRYLGGLLSGYDLLSGPLSDLANNPANVAALLEQAQNLANNLSYAFDTPSGVPRNNLYFNNRSTDGSDTNGLATIGTLVLEWTRLSDLTGNDTYAKLAQKGESYLLDPQPAWAQPWPGLVGTNVNLTTGLFVDASGGWNGGDDSFYEYLIKMYVYDTARFSSYKDRWVLAADSTMANLASHPSSRPELTFLAMFENTTLVYDSGHLACFDGGNFILGGLSLGEQRYVDFGLELVEACENTYNQTLTGIGPESFSWNVSALPANQTTFYERAGFYITDSGYILRPEVIESFYYAYRATGSQIYRDWAWNAFVAINATTRVGSGFSEITDVNAPNGGSFVNFQESFLFAEVLKYR